MPLSGEPSAPKSAAVRPAAPKPGGPRPSAAKPASPAAARPTGPGGKRRRRKGLAPAKSRGLVLAGAIGGGALLLALLAVGGYALSRTGKRSRDAGERLAVGPVAGENEPAPQPQAAPPAQPGAPPGHADQPQPAPPPTPLRYVAKPDPAAGAAEKPVLADALRIPLEGPDPVFASGDGPYYLDMPGPNERGVAVVYDLQTGRRAGTMEAPRLGLAPVKPRLSPDGQHLLVSGSKRGALEVWQRGDKEPARSLEPPGPVLWMDFASPEEAVTVSDAGAQYQIQRWRIADGKATHSFTLAHQPPALRPARGGPQGPRLVTAALSPGRRYLAVAEAEKLVLIALADGQPAGGLGGWQGTCRGLAFSPDGAELLAVYADKPRGEEATLHLLAWGLEDGKCSLDTELSGTHLSGTPLPGPEPGTVILTGRLMDGWEIPYGQVIDRESGLPLYDLPFCPVRWLGEKALLGYKPVEWRHTGSQVSAHHFQKRDVYTAAFDRDDYRSKTRLARAAVGPRPEAGPGDRTAVRSLKPEPGAWAVPADPGKPLAVKSAAAQVEWGEVLFTGPQSGQAGVVFLQNHDQPRPRQSLMWSRYDLKSGHRIGEPCELWPWVQKKQARPPAWAPREPESKAWIPGSLHPEGTYLAVQDPASRNRVDVWTAERKRVLGLVPYGEGAELEWLGWAPAGYLLTMGQGKLTAWEVPSGRAVYEVEGGYHGVAALSPGGAWVAVTAADHLDVLDTTAGQCRGRLAGGDPSAGGWSALAVSFDGRRLAGLRCRAVPDDYRRTVYVWGLDSGKAQDTFPIGPGPGQMLRWCGSNHVLVDQWELVSLEVRTTVLTIAANLRTAASTPDGRVWLVEPIREPFMDKPPSTGSLVACTLPDPRTIADLPGPAPARQEVVYHPGMTVTLEVECGNAERNAAAASLLSDKLRQAGFTVGAGAWKLVLTAEQKDSSTKLTGALGAEVPVPEVQAQLRVVAPDGATALAIGKNLHFNSFRSKYYKSQETGANFQTRVTHYDFGGQDPHAAMADEVWEHWMKDLPRLSWTSGLIKTGNTYKALPLGQAYQADPPGS